MPARDMCIFQQSVLGWLRCSVGVVSGVFEDIDPGHLGVIGTCPLSALHADGSSADRHQISHFDISVSACCPRGMLAVRHNLDGGYLGDFEGHCLSDGMNPRSRVWPWRWSGNNSRQPTTANVCNVDMVNRWFTGLVSHLDRDRVFRNLIHLAVDDVRGTRLVG
jgi:hypothetical protein